MKIRKEIGSALLSILVVLGVGVFILFSLRELISGYLLQERVLLQVISDKDVKIDKFRQQIYQEDFLEVLEWEVIGLSKGCRLLGDEFRYLGFSIGWYGRRLSDECLLGAKREIVGVYNMRGEDTDGSYAYLVKEREVRIPPRIERWNISSLMEGVQVEVVYNAERYRYVLNGDIKVDEILVLQSVVTDGFSLIIENRLWRLPMTQEAPYVVASLSLDEGGVLADYVHVDGIYLLQLNSSQTKGLSDIYIAFYEFDEESSVIHRSKRFQIATLKVDAWRLLQVGYYRVFLEVVSQGDLSLLAANWQGSAVWGSQYLWRNKKGVECPLQAEPFMPVDGWVLGCQRAPIFKVNIK